MNFLKFSFLLIFISLLVGFTPTFFKFAFNLDSIQPAEAVSFKTTKDTGKIKSIIVGKSKIPVYLADTEEKRIKGLGGRTSISRNYGIFFIFDYVDYQNIWMKDMLFPIDIIWIDGNSKIVHIEKNVSPDTYPKIFTAPVKARYVLELNAGMSELYDLKIGKKIIFGSK